MKTADCSLPRYSSDNHASTVASLGVTGAVTQQGCPQQTHYDEAVSFCRFLEAELMKNTKHTYHGASYMYKVCH